MKHNNKPFHILILLVMSFLALASCATAMPMSPSVVRDVEQGIRRGERGLRLYVSTRISLERIDRSVEIAPGENIIRGETTRNIYVLSRNRAGRFYQDTPGIINVNGPLYVLFDERYPAISFVQNRGRGDHDRFYLNWVDARDLEGNWTTDPATGRRTIVHRGVVYTVDTETGWLMDPTTQRRIIWFGDEAYTVDYQGGEEPFLRYKLQETSSRRVHRMRGVR